jgi:hypothetical protein
MLGGLADNFEKLAKDDVVKGALAGAFSTGKIDFVQKDDIKGYAVTSFADGKLTVT